MAFSRDELRRLERDRRRIDSAKQRSRSRYQSQGSKSRSWWDWFEEVVESGKRMLGLGSSQAPPRTPTGRRSAAGGDDGPPDDWWPDEHDIETIDRELGGGGGPGGLPPGGPDEDFRTPPPPGRRPKPSSRYPTADDADFGEEILTPQSSNVFAFSYVRPAGSKTGNLYVTFKAPKLNSDALYRGKGRRGGREQLYGTRGKTVIGKSNERGPAYVYFDVPPGVFNRMKAASSKGKFVWDALRVRGSIYGHQYRYQLVQGAVIAGQGGPSGVYVPRKATKAGFRTRGIADVGTGKRGYQFSTLAQQTGFSTRRPPGKRGSR